MAAANGVWQPRPVEIFRGPNGYGFNLSFADGRHFFRVVDEGGAAAEAGVQRGDELVIVNGTEVAGKAHKDIVELIKGGKGSIKAVVRTFVVPSPRNSLTSVPPVEIEIHKGPQGFGFNLARVNNQDIFRKVDAGGAAEKAGARPGDIIVKVGDRAVTGLAHAQVVDLIRAEGSPLRMTIRVASAQDIASMTQSSVDQQKARILTQARQDIERAQREAAAAAAQQREVEERLRAMKLEEERVEGLKDEMSQIDLRIEQLFLEQHKLQDKAEEELSKTRGIANFKELKDFQDLMGKLEQSVRAEQQSEVARLEKERSASQDPWMQKLITKKLELLKAELDQELVQIRLEQLRKLQQEAGVRRAQEEVEDTRRQQDLKAARERDLKLLKEKQERMDRMLHDAQQQRAREEEEIRQQKAAREAERAAANEARAREVERLRQQRQEEQAKKAIEEERRAKQEAADREFQEKEAARLAAQAQKRADEEAERQRAANAAVLFGGAGLKKVSRPEPSAASAGAQHPMIALMAKQREQQDTRF